MEKKLYIVRHAKAIYDKQDDHNRPLSLEGIEDCKKLARFIKANHEIPQIIIASDSVRTTQTAENIKNEVDFGLKIITTPTLYNASEQLLFKTFTNISDTISSAMIIAHNPGVEKLCLQLINNSEHDVQPPTAIFPATVMAFTAEIDEWQKLNEAKITYKWFFQP